MLWGAVSSDRNRICRCVSKGSSASLCRVSDYSGEKVTISDLSIESLHESPRCSFNTPEKGGANAFLFINAKLRPWCSKAALPSAGVPAPTVHRAVALLFLDGESGCLVQKKKRKKGEVT